MALTGKIGDHILDTVKGWPFGDVMDVATTLASSVTVAPVWPGTVVSVNAQKQFVLGCVGYQMPHYLINGTTSLDVDLPTGGGEWTNVLPAKVLTALTATGGYLLESSEYNKAGSPTYNVNDRLKAPSEAQVNGADKTRAGRLFKTTAYASSDVAFTHGTQTICGIVAMEGAYTNKTTKTQVLQFYPLFVPGSET